ncbi:AAA family ATPase [Streptomyces puniciscabiei]|uniref:AAA family ATPase n=1 Tax=Streptomyces puniciscabiei TaxID=164348 RepID=UPI003325BB01
MRQRRHADRVGWPARSGKSSVAEGLGRALPAVVVSVDPVEAAMRRAGVDRGQPTGLAAYLVAEAVADGVPALGQNAIIDAVNAVEAARRQGQGCLVVGQTPTPGRKKGPAAPTQYPRRVLWCSIGLRSGLCHRAPDGLPSCSSGSTVRTWWQRRSVREAAARSRTRRCPPAVTVSSGRPARGNV